MNESLFTLLMNLVERSLSQIQSSTEITEADNERPVDNQEPALNLDSPQYLSMRVFTPIEQMKMTKASYQFLTRMKLWGMITPDLFELVMIHLQLSASHTVTLAETKWATRKVLAPQLDFKQLAFLDLVLYQKEDATAAH